MKVICDAIALAEACSNVQRAVSTKASIPAIEGILMKAQSTLEETSVEVTASTQAMKQAAVVITALPVAIVYPFLQKYFTKGMLVGGIKG